MAPKKGKGKKGKKGKSGGGDKKAAASVNTEEGKRLLLIARAKALKSSAESEDRQFNEFQRQREKLHYFWIVEKRNLEDKKAELRNRAREKEDLEEKHAVEIKVYKQRVKHLLYEHQNEVAQLRLGGQTLLLDEQETEMKAEAHLKKDHRALKVSLKEREQAHVEYVKSLKREQDKAVTALRKTFERRSRELQLKFGRKSRTLRERLESQRRLEIQRIEQRKDAHIAELMKAHEKAFGEIKNYYNDITHNNLDLIKSLKEEVEEMKKKESADEKLMFEIAQENKRMSEPLKQALRDVEQLRKRLEDYSGVKKRLRDSKARLMVKEDGLRALKWEHEVLTQRFQIVEKERDDLYEQFQATIYDVQQKSGFRNMLFEKKLSVYGEELEKTDGQLNHLIHSFNLEPQSTGSAQRKVEDILTAKNDAIKELQQSLAQAILRHNETLAKFEEKLEEYDIPVAELGFKPKMQTMPPLPVA